MFWYFENPSVPGEISERTAFGRPESCRPLGKAASYGKAASGTDECAVTAINEKSTRVKNICFIFSKFLSMSLPKKAVKILKNFFQSAPK